jgi:hypothetical protein
MTPTSEKQYRLVSRANLPLRMNGPFTFTEAYITCCDWNFSHVAEDMALIEEIVVAEK